MSNELFNVDGFIVELNKGIDKNRTKWDKEYQKVLPIDTSPRADDVVLRKSIVIPPTKTYVSSSTVTYKNSLDIPLPKHKMNYYDKRNTVNEKNFNQEKTGYLEKCQDIGVEQMYDEETIDKALEKL